MNTRISMNTALARKMVLVIAGVCAFSTGCATMVHGVDQAIPIDTEPSGAAVEVAGQGYESPCVLRLARRQGHKLVISKSGYRTENREIASVPTRAILGNIWLGGLVGMGVDAMSGANNELVPNQIKIKLEPEPEDATAVVLGGSSGPQ